jgi:hypothetical protein
VDAGKPRLRVVDQQVSLLAEGDLLLEVSLRALELVHLAQPGAEHPERRCDPQLEPEHACHVEAAQEVLDAELDLAGHQVRGADHVQGKELLPSSSPSRSAAASARRPQTTPSALSRLSMRSEACWQ